MPKKVEGLEQLLIEELQDLFDAEKQLVKALPKMVKSASNEDLGTALAEHLEVTKKQVQRLEQVFESMDMRARGRACKGMQGIVGEGQEALAQGLPEGVQDAAIAGSARKVEHYEIAGYESARSIARQLGMNDAAKRLEETLREEMQADRQLAQISRRLLKEAQQQQKMAARQEAEPAGSKSYSRPKPASRRKPSRPGREARPLTSHEEIRIWAEERGARPACVRGTGGHGDIGMIRLEFPGFSGDENLEEISWDEWFEKFDENNLALMAGNLASTGEKSNFNKLVKRETAAEGEQPKARHAH